MFDTIFTVNNNHGSAAHADFDGKILEKNNLKLDTVLILVTDYQSAILAYSDCEIWKDRFPVLDDISPLTIHKKSGRSTGSDRDGLTGKNNYHLNLT